MPELQTLLTLPFDTLLGLAMGYVGLRAAYAGRLRGRGAIDVLFLTAVFAMIAKGGQQAVQAWTGQPALAYLAAGAATIALAMAWRARRSRRIGARR